MRKALFLSALILGCTSPGFAAPADLANPVFYSPPASMAPPAPDRAFRRLTSRLGELRRIALEMRESDGGTLTAEHSDSIQVKIDAAFAAYRRHRRNSTW